MAFAHDFTATVDGQRLCFEITNKTKKTVAVTYEGSISDHKTPELTGTVEIPPKVRHNDVVYDVTAIGGKAFANAARLKGIVIPPGVESIGDFAFEGCDSLANIVFPGNRVTFGQGVFFNCTAISGVAIGSDWQTVDLSMFRWSKALTSVFIPAKIEKIQGVKKLKHLTSITVDPNNIRFSSADGMLYSKDGSTFYACPRAYVGKVTVREGVTKVTDGALIDCAGVTSIDFPSTLKTVSFRETSRMKRLDSVAMRADRPMDTGYIGGKGKFLFQLVNQETRILVPASAKKLYEDALATEPGEYSDSSDGVPYTVTKAELPLRKNIKGTKDLEKN